jgi:hypothetical protein
MAKAIQAPKWMCMKMPVSGWCRNAVRTAEGECASRLNFQPTRNDGRNDESKRRPSGRGTTGAWHAAQ